MSSNDPTTEPLKIVLAKLAESGKLPGSAIDSIYNGEIQVQLTKEFGKNLDDYREGKIDENTFNNIQKSKAEYVTKFKGATKDKRQEPQVGITPELLDKIRQRMPLLSVLDGKIATIFKEDLPFSGKQFLIVLHFTMDLIPFLEVCESLGLDPNLTHIFAKPYLYPKKEQISAYLTAKGYSVHHIDEVKDILKDISEASACQPFIVVEDGGYIIPLLHDSFRSLLDKCVGGVEQTTRGIRNDRVYEKNIAIPVMSVAEADIKGQIEPPHVADAVVRNINNLIPHEKLRGEDVAIMGYGSIGKAIASCLEGKVNITIYDKRADRLLEAQDKGYNISEDPREAVKDKFLVIGCSGETSITLNEIRGLRHGTYLVSATSDQREIGVSTLKTLASGEPKPLKSDDGKIIGTSYLIGKRKTEVHLLADGYPINFWCSESMPDQVSALILGLILVSTIELIQGQKELPKGILIDQVNSCAEKNQLAKIHAGVCSL